MPSDYQIVVKLLEELHNYILAERERHSSIVFLEACDRRVWVCPKQIAEQTLVGDRCRPHDIRELFDGSQLWGKTAVDAEDFLLNRGCERKRVERLFERLPEIDSVPGPALLVEAVDSVY